MPEKHHDEGQNPHRVSISDHIRPMEQELEHGTYESLALDPSRYLETSRFNPNFGAIPTFTIISALHYQGIFSPSESEILLSAMSSQMEYMQHLNLSARKEGRHLKNAESTVLKMAKELLGRQDIQISEISTNDEDDLNQEIKNKLNTGEVVIVLLPDISFFLKPGIIRDRKKAANKIVERAEVVAPKIDVANSQNRFPRTQPRYHTTAIPNTSTGERFKISLNKIVKILNGSEGKGKVLTLGQTQNSLQEVKS